MRGRVSASLEDLGGDVGTLEHAEIVGTCAACGAQTARPGDWARLHESLLCPGCLAAIAGRSEEAGRNLTSAEREWERLWSKVDDILDGPR